MKMNVKKLILFGFVVTLLLGSFWSLQVSFPAPEKTLGNKKILNLGISGGQTSERIAALHLDKCPGGSPPETIVELTEAEVASFPALQSALQTLDESNQTQIMYQTTETEAFKVQKYIINKYRDQFDCEDDCKWWYFEYRGELYSFGIAVPEDGETTYSPQTTTVSEVVSSASGVVVLLCASFVIRYSSSRKRRD